MLDTTIKGSGVSHSTLQNGEYKETPLTLTSGDIDRYRLRETSRSILWKQAATITRQNNGNNKTATPQQVARNAIRPVFCGQKTDKTATFEARPDSNGHVTAVNVMKCADAWCCPVCAPIIREHHAHEINEALRRHHASGGTFLHMLLPLTPSADTPLNRLMELLDSSANRMTASRMWKQRATEMSICGYIATPEIALTEHGEWSPAIRMTLFLDTTPEDDSLSDFRLLATKYWTDAVASIAKKTSLAVMGALPTIQKAGIHGTLLPSWVTRFEKETVPKPNLSPFRLLDDGDKGERDLKWGEFTTTMNTRPAILWSPGLKRKYGITSATDKDIITDGTSYVAVTGRAMPVETVEHTYQCPNGHRTVIPFDRKAEDIPRTWQCQCGQQAPEEGANTQNDDGMPKRTPFDMLMERRTEEELKETLEKRLKMHRDGYLPDYD